MNRPGRFINHGLVASNNSNRSINKYSRYHSLFDKPPTAKFWDGSLEEVSSSTMKSENCNVSNSDVSSRNSSLADTSSPFRTLNRKNLRDAVRAVKGKFRNSHSNRKTKIEVVRPSSQTKLNGEENRISSCQKELDVGLSYLQKVVNKEKLVMLPGSASIILDTVLKLLLVLNEKHLKPTTTALKPQHSAENSLLFTTYNEVYHCLAALLKHTDKLVVEGKVDTNDRTTVTTLNKELKDSIQKLICLLGCNDSLNQSKPILDRTYSLESHASSASSDLCSDKEDIELLHKLDHVNNNTNAKKFERSFSTSDYDPGKPPPKPPHPSTLVLPRSNHLDTGSESGNTTGSRSPPSADSGIESLNADILGNDHHFLTVPCQDDSFLSLDELFTKLNLKNNGILNWSSSTDLGVSDGKLMLDSNSVLNFEKQQFGKQHADEQTTSVEKEELCGDTMIKTKKVTTRQVLKQTVVKTQQASFIHMNGVDHTDDILKQLKALTDGEIKLTETESLKLKNGETVETTNAHKFPTFSVDATDEKINNKRILNSAVGSSSTSLLNAMPGILSTRTKNRPVSDYENNKINHTVKVQHSTVQQSSSVQSICRTALVNGELVAHDSAEKVDSSTVKASKSDTFENGCLTERERSGSFFEESHIKRSRKLEHEQKSEEDTDSSVSYRPRKANVVSSYMRMFGSCLPENPTDFSASSLASYINIRNAYLSHEESNRKKAFTFQFASNGRNQTPPPDKQPWMDLDKSATAPHTVSTKGGRTDYQNLMDLLDLNDRLKFPQPLSIKSGSVPKSLPFRQNAALTYVNFLDELDVCRYLTCKKEKDEGPDIRGGPVDVLIVYATKNVGSQKGSLYQEAFLTTYRTFVCPLSLLTKLIYRYEKFTCNNENDVEKKKVSKNTFSLLVCVVDDLSPVDLTEEVLVLLNEFLFRMVSTGELNLSRYLRQRLGNRYQTKLDFNAELSRIVCSPYSPGSLRNITILDFKSNMLAEQFTYLDWFYFKKIELSELLLWAQQQTEEHSPNLTRFTGHFNNMSYWVRTRILSCNDAKEREMIFAKFLKVMHHLKRIGNFNSLFAMLSALDSGSIRRLEWSKSLTELLSEYTVLTESSQSFKAYRAALAETKPPCLPYIGIILQDLTFVHIGNPNMLPETQCDGRVDVINFAKRWQQYTILDNMRRFKAWPFNIKKNEQILGFLNEFTDHLSEDELWERSEKIKPRNAPTKR